AFIARHLMAPMAMPLPSRPRPTPAPTAREETPRNQAGAYTSVAARNLFSPTRTESPPSAIAAASPAVKPNLFGIVLRDGAPIAYLEDPSTKRVAGYRVGDAVAGGTVQTISSDPGVIPPAAGTVAPGPMMTQPPPGTVVQPGQAMQQPGSPPVIPGRRPLPPN